MSRFVIPLRELRMSDLDKVGGKNASLGEMIGCLPAEVRVPDGFATTAEAFWHFIDSNGLRDFIRKQLANLDVDDIAALTRTGAAIREAIQSAPFPRDLEEAIRAEFARMDPEGTGSYAVRSSATSEDLPDASFAGQQETLLNVVGIDNILAAIREVFSSLYNDRAIAYRTHKGFSHEAVALSAGVQRMVRSDHATSGIMFSLDTESGFRDVVFITASYGLGELVVQGAVNPDEFYVHKPTLAQGHRPIIRRALGSKLHKLVFASQEEGGRVKDVPTSEAERYRFCLSDDEVLELARYAMAIEKHYGRPMDIEWAKDGIDGKIYIVQARPETVKSQESGRVLEKYRLKQHGKAVVSGRAIGQKVGVGTVRVITDLSQMDRVQAGDVLVTDMTDPNWEPIMKRAAAIVTNRGGRTCHAAIIARELGIPAIVGCGNATEVLKDGETVTVSCAEGDTGYVYRGALEFEVQRTDLGQLPELPVKIMMNVGNPELAFEFAQIPNAGVGLARLEFIINNVIGVHPRAILEFDHIPASLREEIARRARGYASPRAFFIDKLAEGIGTIAAAFYPNPVIVRMSDFKSNEYRKLLGGDIYEPEEENPMLGFRGAARYIAPSFRECFEMECEALKKVRHVFGLKNVKVMIPFVRTVAEGERVVKLLAANGLKRGEDGLEVIMMCEVPSNALLPEEFLAHFDGFSIGSNDLTQLTLGLDRDSGLVAESFDERDPAVRVLLGNAIDACNKLGKYVGICGQGPSDHPDFAEWLMDRGIQTISLNPDTVIDTWMRLGEHVAQRSH